MHVQNEKEAWLNVKQPNKIYFRLNLKGRWNGLMWNCIKGKVPLNIQYSCSILQCTVLRDSTYFSVVLLQFSFILNAPLQNQTLPCHVFLVFSRNVAKRFHRVIKACATLLKWVSARGLLQDYVRKISGLIFLSSREQVHNCEIEKYKKRSNSCQCNGLFFCYNSFNSDLTGVFTAVVEDKKMLLQIQSSSQILHQVFPEQIRTIQPSQTDYCVMCVHNVCYNDIKEHTVNINLAEVVLQLLLVLYVMPPLIKLIHIMYRIFCR